MGAYLKINDVYIQSLHIAYGIAQLQRWFCRERNTKYDLCYARNVSGTAHATMRLMIYNGLQILYKRQYYNR